MKAIFYDRKNKCEVSSDQLMEIKLVETYMLLDENIQFPKDKLIGSLGYKSNPEEKSQKHINWDKWTNIQDLVFLRLE